MPTYDYDADQQGNIISTGKKVLKTSTALGTGIILGEIATKFIPGGAWIPVKGIAYLASIVLSDMISKKTDSFIDEEVDTFVEEAMEEGA